MSLNSRRGRKKNGRPDRVRFDKPPPTDITSMLNKAKGFIRKKNPNKAVRILEKLLSENPYHIPAIAFLIKAYAMAGRLKRAEDTFAQALDEGLAKGHAHVEMAISYAEAGMDWEARSMLDNAIHIGDDDPLTFSTLIAYYGKRELPAESIRIFNIVHERGMVDASIYGAILDVCVENNLPAEVSRYANMAAEEGKADAPFFCTAILHLEKAEMADTARQLCDDALKAGKHSPELSLAMLRIYMETGDVSKTREVLDLCIQKKMSGRILTQRMIRILYSMERFDAIVDLVDSLPQKLRGIPPITLLKAEALRKMRRYEDAKDLVESLLCQKKLRKIEGHHAKVIIGFCLKEMGRLNEAFQVFSDLFRDAPPESPHYPRICCGLVFTWQELGFDGRIDPESAQLLSKTLRGFEKDANKNLLNDIRCARIALDEYYPRSSRPGGYMRIPEAQDDL